MSDVRICSFVSFCLCLAAGCSPLIAKNTHDNTSARVFSYFFQTLCRFLADKTHDDISNILQQWKTNNQQQLQQSQQLQPHLHYNNHEQGTYIIHVCHTSITHTQIHAFICNTVGQVINWTKFKIPK